MNWTTVSLRQYNDIKDVFLNPEFSEEDRIILLINILFGVDALKLKTSELNKYVNDLKFLNTTPPRMKLKDKYRLGENTYVLKKDLKDFNVAMWLDWNNFLKNGSDTDNYANLLSVFFIPEGKDVKEYGEGYDIEQVRQDINNYLSIADATSIASFFLRYQKGLLIASLLYTRKKVLKTSITKEQKRKVKRQFRKLIWKTLLAGD